MNINIFRIITIVNLIVVCGLLVGSYLLWTAQTEDDETVTLYVQSQNKFNDIILKKLSKLNKSKGRRQ